MKHFVWSSFLLVFIIIGCRPTFDDRESIITGPRILAVRAEPPESLPGQNITYQALVVTPQGAMQDVPLHWSFCAAPKPLTENNSVNAECLGNAVRPIKGTAMNVTATTPNDTCQLFGPDTPPGDFRPRDPDESGGFYQPLRLEALGETAFALERIRCNLPNAPLDIAIELAQQYVPNRNPRLLPIQAFVDGVPTALDALKTRQTVRLDVGWHAEDTETFLAFDPAKQMLAHRREALRVFWYATSGAFKNDVTGRAAEDEQTTVANDWHAPDDSGPVFLWVVVRDNRGGMDFAAYTLSIL